MHPALSEIESELDGIRAQSLWKTERPIRSPQGVRIRVEDGREVLNFCANNYLGLAGDPALIAAAKLALERHGLGMASVRFICGTSDLHKELEAAIAAYVEQEDAILYAACFDANGGVFEPLLGENDAVVSDSLNHASIIDGIRLCKAKRFRYAAGDMEDLARQLEAARGSRRVVVVSDGVFSMDGTFANLREIRRLADEAGALLMVDDCHATGFIGPEGRGTPRRAGIKVDILTSTLGKALGGTLGGFVAAAKPVIDLLRQRSRPYLFSNALPPMLCAAAIAAIALARGADDLRTRLATHARTFRSAMTDAGFKLLDGEHPIVPVMLGEARLAQAMAARLYEEGVYVSGFFYPVVPHGRARIRAQMCAAMTDGDIAKAVAAFVKVGKELRAI